MHIKLISLVLVSAFALTAQAATHSPSSKPKTTKSKKATKPATARPMELIPATTEQLDAASLVYLGTSDCEFGKTIETKTNPQAAGYVDVAFAGKTYVMRPVLSSTGALRLEDVTGKTLLLQISNKSMLMDVQVGHRLVDGCMNEKQKEFKADPETSIGINN